MDEFILKAEALIESIGYIRAYRDRHTVIKLGGSAMEDAAAVRATLQSVVFMTAVGLRPVLVHGGGKPIDRAMAASGLTPKKILGRRYTDDATLRIVVDVLTNDINAGIVRQIRELGCEAVGMHTGPNQALHGARLTLPGNNGEPIDLGRVGHVTQVQAEKIEAVSKGGAIPVIPSLAYDAEGGWLNVNADTAACGVATALKAVQLVIMTDTPGILKDAKDQTSLIRRLDWVGCQELVANGAIDGGMLPKVEACFDSLKAGVGLVKIIDGRRRFALLLDVFGNRETGTEIVL